MVNSVHFFDDILFGVRGFCPKPELALSLPRREKIKCSSQGVGARLCLKAWRQSSETRHYLENKVCSNSFSFSRRCHQSIHRGNHKLTFLSDDELKHLILRVCCNYGIVFTQVCGNLSQHWTCLGSLLCQGLHLVLTIWTGLTSLPLGPSSTLTQTKWKV